MDATAAAAAAAVGETSFWAGLCRDGFDQQHDEACVSRFNQMWQSTADPKRLFFIVSSNKEMRLQTIQRMVGCYRKGYLVHLFQENNVISEKKRSFSLFQESDDDEQKECLSAASMIILLIEDWDEWLLADNDDDKQHLTKLCQHIRHLRHTQIPLETQTEIGLVLASKTGCFKPCHISLVTRLTDSALAVRPYPTECTTSLQLFQKHVRMPTLAFLSGSIIIPLKLFVTYKTGTALEYHKYLGICQTKRIPTAGEREGLLLQQIWNQLTLQNDEIVAIGLHHTFESLPYSGIQIDEQTTVLVNNITKQEDFCMFFKIAHKTIMIFNWTVVCRLFQSEQLTSLPKSRPRLTVITFQPLTEQERLMFAFLPKTSIRMCVVEDTTTIIH